MQRTQANNGHSSNLNKSNDKFKQEVAQQSDEQAESEARKQSKNKQDKNQTARQAVQEGRPWFTARECIGTRQSMSADPTRWHGKTLNQHGSVRMTLVIS